MADERDHGIVEVVTRERSRLWQFIRRRRRPALTRHRETLTRCGRVARCPLAVLKHGGTRSNIVTERGDERVVRIRELTKTCVREKAKWLGVSPDFRNWLLIAA